ncbi:MAG TPA: hypothetical protein VFR07_11890 [Mycobacteriales bacterium]|jgi:hypothetical protein|nr:hypothetical protein [Mycobacteriales bacterium]
MRPLRTVPLLLLPVVLTAGCSLGASEFNGNMPDTPASQANVVRTPSPVGTDLPFTEAPLVQTPPGPSGGLQGNPPTTVPPASPGEAEDGGDDATAN